MGCFGYKDLNLASVFLFMFCTKYYNKIHLIDTLTENLTIPMQKYPSEMNFDCLLKCLFMYIKTLLSNERSQRKIHMHR